MIHNCGKCVLQHFNPCGDPEHASMYRVAVLHYLDVDINALNGYAGYIGDSQAETWKHFYDGETVSSEQADDGNVLEPDSEFAYENY